MINIEVLNDLIALNNDRIKGYEKAIGELKDEDGDLKPLFTEMIHESHRHKVELAEEVRLLGGEYISGTTMPGKIYRAWMDIKTTLTGNARENILDSCELGENAAQQAYQTALKTDELPNNLRSLLSDQQSELKHSHDHIQTLRDQLA